MTESAHQDAAQAPNPQKGMAAGGHVRASRTVLRKVQLSKLERDIVEVLQKDGRRPYSQIARDVGAAEKTVRNTVGRLEESQAIDITAVTFPDLLGYTGAATCGITVAPGHDIRAVAAALARVDVINYVAVTVGSFDIFADVVCRDKEALLETFLYLNVTYRSFGFTELSPRLLAGKRPLKLTEMDRRIFTELAHNGRESYHEVARRLEVSESLVRQRVKRATDAGVLSINALVNPASLGAEVIAWVGLKSASAGAVELATTLARWPSASYVAMTAGRYDVFVELACRDEDGLIGELAAISQSDLVEHSEPFVYLDLQVKALILV